MKSQSFDRRATMNLKNVMLLKKFLAIAILITIALVSLTNNGIKTYVISLFSDSKLKINPKVKFYDKTEWGDPLEKIRILYPDGTFEDTEGEVTSYTIDSHVGHFKNKIFFHFNRDNFLISIRLIFYSQKSPSAIFITRDDAQEVYSEILSLLRTRYGDPYQQSISNDSDEDWSIWVGESTLIKLDRMHIDKSSENSFIIQVDYHSEYSFSQKDKTEGL
jgi:hypothetical protein